MWIQEGSKKTASQGNAFMPACVSYFGPWSCWWWSNVVPWRPWRRTDLTEVKGYTRIPNWMIQRMRKTRWWFWIYFVSSLFEEMIIPIRLNIFQMGWNHQVGKIRSYHYSQPRQWTLSTFFFTPKFHLFESPCSFWSIDLVQGGVR